MKVFSIRIKGIDGALGLRLDGLENAKWLLSRLRLMMEPSQPVPGRRLAVSPKREESLIDM